jgi:hypothetical protein
MTKKPSRVRVLIMPYQDGDDRGPTGYADPATVLTGLPRTKQKIDEPDPLGRVPALLSLPSRSEGCRQVERLPAGHLLYELRNARLHGACSIVRGLQPQNRRL